MAISPALNDPFPSSRRFDAKRCRTFLVVFLVGGGSGGRGSGGTRATGRGSYEGHTTQERRQHSDGLIAGNSCRWSGVWCVPVRRSEIFLLASMLANSLGQNGSTWAMGGANRGKGGSRGACEVPIEAMRCSL
jgi:hypothetical protein